MKKQILTLVALTGLACGAFGQGQVFLDNTANTSTSPNDPNNGVLFQLVSGNPVLLNQNVNLTLLGGSTAGNLSVIASIYGDNATGDSYGNGVFSDPAGAPYNVTGVSGGGTAFFQLEAWIGSATSYAAASLVTGTYVGISTVWSQATGNAPVSGAPNSPAATLTGLPSFTLTQVAATPEPSTLAMAGLGGFGMLMAMRRKKA
jgi:hypothetical protein